MAAKANFNAYHNYAIDSLHQWDRNQVLTLRGLNLATAPEVHFSNKNMDRAIVRQATMVNHVVTVNIPNSLLQDPLRIYAHIGIYEGNAFTVVETVEIPVIPRIRPCDYQIEDNDGEVYSFKALENKMANMATRDQVANIVASISSDSELVDVRYGADGKTYASAGEAVRTQLEQLDKKLENATPKIDLSGVNMTAGAGIYAANGNLGTLDTFSYSDYIDISKYQGHKLLILSAISGWAGFAFYKEDKTYIGGVNGDSPGVDGGTVVQYYAAEVPAGAKYIRFSGFNSYDATAAGYRLFAVYNFPANEAQKDRAHLIHYAQNVLCIGDSLTAGAYYDTSHAGDAITENYPHFMEKMTGLNVTNAGRSGRTPIVWHDEAIELYNYAEHDLFLVWLGTNGGLTDTLAADTASGNAATFAKTNTGYYCKIIERIIADNPDAVIVLGNCYTTSGPDLATTNDVIRQIAAKYSGSVLGVVDNNDGTLYQGEDHELLHPFGNATHFGKVGNMRLAKHWLNGVCRLIEENESKFEFVLLT